MDNIIMGILTESFVISRGIQFIFSRNTGLSSYILVDNRSNITQYIKDNNINLLIVSDSIFSRDDIQRIYKTSKDINFGIIRINKNEINPMFEFKLDFELNDNENVVKLKIDNYIATTKHSNKLSIEDSELSKREIEILRHVALGYTNQIISDLLFISKHTVVTHRKKITAKLGIKTISGLTVYALLNNIIETNEIEELK